jgi:hypothetical protein
MDEQPITNADLTSDDMELLKYVLDEFIEHYDPDFQSENGISNPSMLLQQANVLYGRFIGVDLSGDDAPIHHIDCTCDWCELERLK